MRKEITQIIRQYLTHRYTPETEERVQRWLIDDASAQEKEQASLEVWKEMVAEAGASATATDAATRRSLQRVNARIGQPHKQIDTSLRIYLMRIAAVLIPVCLLVGGYFYTKNDLTKISTAYGEERYIMLPDSSEVWLNAGTTLEYPTQFNARQRNVTLRGEAFFSVKRNTAQPFIVHTAALSVEVLGTTFNVKAYPDDERVLTTLRSGKVLVETAGSKAKHILQPNQQLSYQPHTLRTEITEVTPEETRGWGNGRLIFSHASLREIAQTLQRRFNRTIEVHTTASSQQQRYTIKLLQQETLEEILATLKEVTPNFTYRRQGTRIILHLETENQLLP